MAERMTCKPNGFGIATTVVWTEIHDAMVADGMTPPTKCGPNLTAWISKTVTAYLTQPAQAVDVGEPSKQEVDALSRCVGDLERFIELAKDYDLDEMAVQSLQTAIESMQMRASRAIGNAQAEGRSVSDDAAERLAQYIYEQEARERCKTLDESVSHRSNWRRAIPEARKMLEVALLPTPPTQATPDAHE